MNAHRSLAALVVAVALTACGAGEQQEAREPPPVEDTVFGDAVATMDKARAVQDTMNERKEELDEAMKAAEAEATR